MYIYEVASESSRNSMVKFTGIATVNTEMYTSVLRRVRDEVRKKRPEKWRTKSLFLLHHNAPAHRSVLVKGFLSKKQRNKTVASPILSWPASTWFLPVPWTETSIEGRRFCDVTDIVKNATEELKRLLQDGFPECFQHLYLRRQKCIVAWGVYFEGNLAQMVVLYCIAFLRNKWFRKHFEDI